MTWPPAYEDRACFGAVHDRGLAHRPAHAPGAQLPGLGRPTDVRAR